MICPFSIEIIFLANLLVLCYNMHKFKGWYIMANKEELLEQLELFGLDAPFLIQQAFLGYKYQRSRNKQFDPKAELPTKLIRMYYGLNPDEVTFNELKKSFVTHYIQNESEFEKVSIQEVHGKEEVEGLKRMYSYIHSDEIEYMFNVYTLKDLHQKLFSCTSYPDLAGNFRNIDVYLPGSGVELCEWSLIRDRLNVLDEMVLFLREYAPIAKASTDVDDLLFYLDACVELNAQLIKVHPFFDGNGRTIRGFTNKLLEDVGLPPIYVKPNEREDYGRAMNLALTVENYQELKNFYRYKICDSIVELDINAKVRQATHHKVKKIDRT